MRMASSLPTLVVLVVPSVVTIRRPLQVLVNILWLSSVRRLVLLSGNSNHWWFSCPQATTIFIRVTTETITVRAFLATVVGTECLPSMVTDPFHPVLLNEG